MIIPIISIIVPVYKVEKYLRRCLDSVISQTFSDYECILVDDGSPDECPEICDEYVNMDSRFKVIHKKQNEGLPLARKTGLDNAKSTFVMHLDSDDWIEKNALELLYLKQKETDADIVIGNFNLICSWGIEKEIYKPIKSDENVTEWFIRCKHKYLWGKLYKRELFGDYDIPKTNIFEDGIVNIQIFSNLTFNQVQFIDSCIYNYNRIVDNSLIVQINKNKYNSYLECPMTTSKLYIEDFLKKKYKNYEDNIFCVFAYFFINSAIITYLLTGNRISKNEINFLYKNYYKKCSNLLKPHRRIVLPLYNISTIIGYMYFVLYNIFIKTRRIILKKNIKDYMDIL